MKMVTEKLVFMPDEVRQLSTTWKSNVGEIPHLTRELEKEFRFGRQVIKSGDKYLLGGSIKGGSSMMFRPCSVEDYKAYLEWQKKEGITYEDDPESFYKLYGFLSKFGIKLCTSTIGEVWSEGKSAYLRGKGYVFRMAMEIFTRLPEEHLVRDEFHTIVFGGYGDDAAKGSSYEDGMVRIYDFAIQGAKRTYIGLLLHEIGHSNDVFLEKTMCYEELRSLFCKITRKDFFGTEYLLSAESRLEYTSQFITEFLAEFYMIYTSQGTRLRQFILSLSGEARDVLFRFYDILKDSFFGYEYA